MKRKDIKKLLIVLGLLLVIVGGVLVLLGIIKKSNIVLYDGTTDLSSDKTYVFKGQLNVIEGAKDPDFQIDTDSPVLVRNVEMVQYYKGENGVRTVLANYPIESFEDNGTEYNNPAFPDDVTTKIFYGTVTLDKDNHVLDGNALKPLSANEYEFFDKAIEKETITELPEEAGNRYNLTYHDDAYVTASDEWSIGEIKVTFLKVRKDSLDDFTVAGKLTSDGKITPVNSKKGIPLVFNHDVSINEINSLIYGRQIINYCLIGLGILICVIGLLMKKGRTGKNITKESL